MEDLSFGAMLLVDLQKGRFGIGVDGLFARVSPEGEVGDAEIDVTSDSAQLAVLPQLLPRRVAVRRVLLGPPAASDRGAGGRLPLHLHEHRARHRGGPSVDGSESWVDPLIGSRIGLDLSDRWALAGEADIGGFGVGSDFTWNVQAFVGYRTTLFGQPTTWALGYRALYQDYDDDGFEWDVTIHGPVLGAALRF